MSIFITRSATLKFLVSSLEALRFTKMVRFLLGTRVLLHTLRSSFMALVIPSYLLLMLLSFFGTILFAVEYDPLDTSGGGRVPDVTTSWWMLLTTMTTVGYGDYSPQTTAGRVLTFFCMIAGLTMLAMPLAIVGSSFQACA